jgi:cytochrome c oxidase cbb3-type subunit IV
MYKDILLTITGIEVFPIISLILFVVAFASILIAAARMDRGRADQFATLPLDDVTVRPESRKEGR